MRHLFIYMVCLTLATSAAAQEQDAFYVYQNDGHFDGFFYDEVEKIRYSKTDTLGFEHEVFVSQEIVTADSTYRFMLTAIDSIGFHQPEIIYNPRLRVLTGGYSNCFENQWYGEKLIDMSVENPTETFHIYHDEPSNLPPIPRELYPKPGDVFANFDEECGWSGKVVSVEEEYGELIVHFKPIDDITDIFQQYVAVEKYSHDGKGNLLSRRVAGHPELTVDRSRTRAFDDFDYNLLNFSINGHIPLLSEDDMVVSVDPSIEGKVDLRIVYDLSFWGSKYIGITTDVALGASVGLSIDGPIKKVMKTNLGKFALIPLPATTPILTLDIGPDAFVRAEGHFHASVISPKAQGKFWVKLEIKDWWPHMDFGAGSSNPDKDAEEAQSVNNTHQASIELNGFVQSGTLFPMNIKSLPLIEKLFNAKIGGTWYVGPKFSGAIKLDLLNALEGDNDLYTNLKGTHVSLGLMDFDYEVTAEVTTAFSEKKEWTMLDGTLNLWPTIDLNLFPDFEDCEVYTKLGIDTNPDGSNVTYDCYAFNPEGNVFLPQTVGVGLYYIDENGKETATGWQAFRDRKYYQLENRKNESNTDWPALTIPSGMLEGMVTNECFPRESGGIGYKTGKFRLRPLIDTGINAGFDEVGISKGIIKATPAYDIQVDSIWKTSSDTIFVNYDGSIARPVRLTGHLDGITPYVPHYGEERFPEWVVTKGGKGNVEISVDQEKYLAAIPKNYSMVDTLWVDDFNNLVSKEANYRLPVQFSGYARFGTNTVTSDEHGLYVAVLPNAPDVYEDPVAFRINGVVRGDGWYVPFDSKTFTHPTCTVSRDGNVWHCTFDASRSIYGKSVTMTATFDIVSMKNCRYKIQNGNIYYNESWNEKYDGKLVSNYQKVLWTFGDILYDNVYGETRISSAGSGSYTATVKLREDPAKTNKGEGVPNINFYFQDYINSHPEEFQ